MPTPSTRTSYDPLYFASLYAIEDRHFWFQGRNRIIGILVKQEVARLTSAYRVLEVGCGTGNVLRILRQVCTHGHVIGMDLFGEGLQFARRRANCSLVQGDIHLPPFGVQFELVCLFDVLEHLPDDRQILRGLWAMLVPGGVLFLTVPADPSLWSYFDEESHHCRRYERLDLERKLVDTGFQVEYLTPWMTTIFPLVWLGRRVAGLIDRQPADAPGRAQSLTMRELRIIPVANDILSFLVNREAYFVARRRQLPIGTSLLAIAHKG